MAFAITQSCCSDASCVQVCPVDCIHPAPGEPDFGKTEILYVDPRSCIDCGACADACPASAIKPIEILRGAEVAFAQINADFYLNRPDGEYRATPTHARVVHGIPEQLRVAVVGTGPAASYAARELLAASNAEVTIIDRLPAPGGLLRGGVAPDHGETKRVIDVFDWTYHHPRAALFMNVEVGTDISHEDLLDYHHAVVYGVGAPHDRPLGIPGEDLAGVYGATQVVGWYNGDPDTAADLLVRQEGRVFVVGNGNVALDIARILLSDPSRLSTTEIADHALEVLRDSDIREVVLLGRRGVNEAAFTRPELLTLPDGIELVIEREEQTAADLVAAEDGSKAALLRDCQQVDSDWSAPPAEGRRLVLAFHTSVREARGENALESIVIDRSGLEEVPATTLISSIGRVGRAIEGVPFDVKTSAVPHDIGRVLDEAGNVVDGTYVVGWAKRGATGGIGANRADAQETVQSLLNDAAAGRLAEPKRAGEAFAGYVSKRQPKVIRERGVTNIERRERAAGQKSGRPLVKLTSKDSLLAAARGRGR